MDEFTVLRDRLRRFAAEREWDQFHTPKNLVLALTGEVGELAAVLQWLSDEELRRVPVDETLQPQLADEMADVLLYLVRLADVMGVDLLSEAYAKIDRNERRYPSDAVRGSAIKYTQLQASPSRPGEE